MCCPSTSCACNRLQLVHVWGIADRRSCNIEQLRVWEHCIGCGIVDGWSRGRLELVWDNLGSSDETPRHPPSDCFSLPTQRHCRSAQWSMVVY